MYKHYQLIVWLWLYGVFVLSINELCGVFTAQCVCSPAYREGQSCHCAYQHKQDLNLLK